MQIRPTAFTIGLIIHPSIALFCVYTEFGIDSFKKWKYAALIKRDECSDGLITPQEFTDWLEQCFPNRKKPTKKQ